MNQRGQVVLWLALTALCSIHGHSNNTIKDIKDYQNSNEYSLSASSFVNKFEDNEIKVCIGTNRRMSVPSNWEFHYKMLRYRYTNCTHVDGNLEITWIQNNSYDLSFLQHIREVTGYVLISHVDLMHVKLPRLQIIRGRTPFKLNVWNNEFGLFVSFSQMKTLELPALRDILNGSVGIFNNYNLCYIRTIDWDEIISGEHLDPSSAVVVDKQLHATNKYTYNYTSPERARNCPLCHSSCKKGCWGEGPENCQKFSKTNCSPQCSKGRCFGPAPRQCCHSFCAGGCTGPTQKDCLACKNFYDDGECKQQCPALQVYNPKNDLWEPNPNGKFAYGAICVKHCPEYLMKDNGACVRTCLPNKMSMNGECVQCNGPCPENCSSDGIVHSGNIDNYKNCTIIEGSLEIIDQTFHGYQQVYSNFSFGPRFIKLHPDRLEVFSTLKEITGYLNIQGYHEQFTNLSYFRNLEVIGGRQLTENLFTSLFIAKTSLRSLGLKSLKSVNFGSIVIVENKHLCFVEDIAWNKISKSREHDSVIRQNRNSTECKLANEVCSEECSDAGCWGVGADECLECKNYVYKGMCLSSCNSRENIYRIDNKTCGDCHEQCKGTCRGPNADDCI